jgi:hypothetical protein
MARVIGMSFGAYHALKIKRLRPGLNSVRKGVLSRAIYLEFYQISP